MARQPELSTRERDAWTAYTEVRVRLDRAVEDRLRSGADLSLSEFEVLKTLNGAPGRRLRTGELATALGWERSRISHLTRRMTERGSITRTSCAEDARGTWIGLTSAGRLLLVQAIRGHNELLRELVFDALGDEGTAHLESVASRLDASLPSNPCGGPAC
jgi:DNA-binding MarR family transcriptional regulator